MAQLGQNRLFYSVQEGFIPIEKRALHYGNTMDSIDPLALYCCIIPIGVLIVFGFMVGLEKHNRDIAKTRDRKDTEARHTLGRAPHQGKKDDPGPVRSQIREAING